MPPSQRTDPATGSDAPAEQDGASRLLTLSEASPGIDLPLATAAVLSARFPLVTPAGTLPGEGPKRRYVDGGYFENSGLTTVLDVIDELRKVPAEADALLVILRIENSRATTNAQNAAGSPKLDQDGAFAEAVSPIKALLATRQARGELARTTVARVIRDAKAACAAKAATAEGGPARSAGPANGCLQVEEVLFALEPACVPIPLGWSLTESARREMRQQLQPPVPRAAIHAPVRTPRGSRGTPNRSSASSSLWVRARAPANSGLNVSFIPRIPRMS